MVVSEPTHPEGSLDHVCINKYISPDVDTDTYYDKNIYFSDHNTVLYVNTY